MILGTIEKVRTQGTTQFPAYFITPDFCSFGRNRGETQHFHKNGSRVDLEVSITILWLEEVPLIAAFVREIADRKQAEELISRTNEELEERVLRRTAELEEANEALQREIAERVQAEEKIRKSEQQLAEAQRLAHFGSWEWDLTTNSVIWSDELIRIFGLNPKDFEMTYERFLNCVHPDDRKLVMQEASAGSTGQSLDFEYRIVRPDGTERVVNALAKVDFDRMGEPIRMIGTAHDITENKRIARELIDSERRYRTLTENLNELVYRADPNTLQATYVNQAIETIYGYTAEEWLGDPNLWENTIHPDDEKRVFTELLEARKMHENTTVEYRIIRKDGTIRWVEDRITWEKDEEKIVSLLGILYDITERKRLEKEILEISERERQHLGGELHDDLGQHLAGIMCLSQVLAQKLVKKSLADEVEAAKQVTKLVTRAIDKVRHLTTDLVPMELKDGGLMSALETLASNVENQFGISCSSTCDTSIEFDDTVTVTQLYRISQEAVHNAIRHGQAKHVAIELKRRNDKITLTVRDDGIGLPESMEEGKGLGMRLMYYRAGLFGGFMDIRSRTGGGTVVACSVPETPRG